MRSDVLEPYSPYFSRTLEAVAKDLESYATLLRKWQPIQNLVSRETLKELETRHFADSLQALRLIGPNDLRLFDLGSGGGFPALPLAIATKGSHRHFTLVEPTSRKVSFLRTVIRDLELNATVMPLRTEQIDSRETGPADVITSRALASLKQLCAWMEPFFGLGTKAILHKGREYQSEIAESAPFWDFDVLVSPSDTDADGVLLTLTNLRAKATA